MLRLLHCVALVLFFASCQAAVGQPRVLLIQNAHIVSVDPQQGDWRDADVLVRDGKIVAVGHRLEAAGAERIDARGMILLPGLVDTHTHLWLSAARGQFRNTPDTDYFALKKRLGRHYTPDDVRIGTYLGAVETLASGVTTTVDFFHNLRSPAHLEAAEQGLVQSGIRARLLLGAHDDLGPAEIVDLDLLAAAAARARPQRQRVTLGFGWRGVGEGRGDVVATGRREIAAARKLGLPVSVHSGGKRNGALAASGLLGKDVQIVHATGATPAELAAFRAAGSALSLTPVTEQRVGYGLTVLSDYAAVGRIGLGIDGTALAGNADLFANMRLLALTETGARKKETAVAPRRILELATIEAARSIGMDDQIGSITPGKRADLILLDPGALNMALADDADPYALIVYSATPGNVDTVIVDGVVLKRGGRLLGVDVPRVMKEARASMDAILERAGAAPQ